MRILVLLLAMTAAARAGGIVLESYTGDRPADASRLLAPVLEELSRKGYTAGDGVARTFESRPALAPKGLPSNFTEQIERGFKAWIGGHFDEAIGALGPAVKTAQANTGAFAVDPSLRDPLLRALIALALAEKGSGDLAAMKAWFAEIVRSFPEAQVPRGTYGPDAQKAFEEVRREVTAAGRGKLAIKVKDDAGVVFINETYRGAGSITVELAPGEYRVVVVMNKRPSRNHVVTVRANAEAAVEIDPKLDVAIHTDGYTGLAFATAADREAHEAPFAAAFAKAAGASAVAVVGIDDVHGHSAVVGALVGLSSGRELRRASIPVEPDPSHDKLRALARFLAGEDAAPGLDVQFSNPAERHDRPVDRGRWGGWRWLTAGLAVGALATGAVLVAMDGRCSKQPPAGQQCNDLYATATPGFITLGAGAVLAGISIYLFATSDKGPYVAPTQGGATVGFATRF